MDQEEQRREIHKILVVLLDAAFTEAGLVTFCAQYFPAAFAAVRTANDKLDRILQLVDHCATHRGQVAALLDAIERAESRQYDRFFPRLKPLLPFPEMTPEQVRTSQLGRMNLLQLQVLLTEHAGLCPASDSRVYAWLRVDEQDFDIVGADIQALSWSESRPQPLTFGLRPRHTGYQRVRLEFYHDSAYLGAIERTIEVPAMGSIAGPLPVPAEVSIYPDLAPPDLMIRFYRADVHQGQATYHYRVTSSMPELPINLKHAGSVTLTDATSVLAPVLADLDQWAKLQSADKADLDARLAALGVDLFVHLIPDDLQELYWNLPRRCRTVQIISDVPGIPWEMLRAKDADGCVEEAFARQFYLTRWHPDAGPAAAAYTLDHVRLFVGQPPPPLPGAEGEARDLEALLGARVARVTPADLRAVLEDRAGFDGLHIIAHGYGQSDNADESYVQVGGGKARLKASDLTVCNWQERRPLLFVNACNVGREGMALTGMGGWASVALKEAQAGAFIGALWQATDSSAGPFARAFYHSLMSGAPIGAAAHAARLAIESHANPTWLSYAVYAHPNARVVAQPVGSAGRGALDRVETGVREASLV